MREWLRTASKRTLSMIMVLCMTISLFAINTAWAEDKTWTEIESTGTSKEYGDIVGEYYEAKTPLNEDDALYVSGKTKQGTKMLLIRLRGLMENKDPDTGKPINYYINAFVKPAADGKFSVKIDTSVSNKNTPIAYNGTVLSADDKAYSSMPGYKSVPKMPQGFYTLQITAAMTDADANVCGNGTNWGEGVLGGKYGFVWENVILYASGSVASTAVTNNPKLVEFTDIININKQMQSADKLSDPTVYAHYTDVYLKDLDYVLKDDNFEKKPMNADRVAYIKKVAKEITADATTNAQKLAKIYQYVADNYYYDVYAHELYVETKINLQCANPYDNLYKQRNKIASINSTSDGKVAVCCDGYSALVVALCRSLGMPARVVIGSTNKINGASSTVSGAKNHWWSEVYIDGRWVTADAQAGSRNSWNRKDLSKTEKDSNYKDEKYKSAIYWDYQGWTVSGLDMSYERRAATFQMVSVQDSTNGKPFVDKVTISNDAATGKPKITWTLLDGYTKYNIYRGTKESNIAWHAIVKSGNTYIDTKAQAGQTYYYWVAPVDASRSDVVSCTCKMGKPALTVSCRASDGKPTLSWSAVDGATKYYIYRSTDGGKSYSYLSSTANTSYTNTGAVAGDTYYFKVCAVTSDGTKSEYSNSKSIVCDCAKPVVTVKCNTTSGKPVVSWSAVKDATSYVIYRATSSSGSYTKMTGTTKTSYTDTSATAGNTYYYKVKAITSKNSNATSAYSTAKSVVCDCAKPVVSITTSAGKPKLSWKAVSGATSYVVYRATSSSGSYTKMTTTTKTSYVNTGATKGKTYYYKVKAISSKNSNAGSAYSAVKSIKATK